MPDVYNWQLGRPMTYRFPEAHPNRQFAFVFNINRCLACQTCTMAQGDLDLLGGPGAHVVEQRRDQAVRRLPQGWDSKLPRAARAGEPWGQTWNTNRAGPTPCTASTGGRRSSRPRRRRAARRRRSATRPRRGVARAEHGGGHGDRPEGRPARTARAPVLRRTRPGSSTSNGYATTARTRRACRRARERDLSDRRTASC